MFICERTVIGGNCVIGDDISIQSMVYIPTDTTIANGVFIGPNSVLTNDPYPPSDEKFKGPVIYDSAYIGANATILPGSIIDEGALVAAGSIVTKDAPPRMLAQEDVVQQFEESFANFCGCAQAIGTNNDTSALHATLLAAGIQPEDEVIVPDFIFIATATTVSMCEAFPVMVDVEEEYYTLDPGSVQDAITSKTKAVIGVHLFGQPFGVLNVQEFCEDASLLLIEDCAQAHGAQFGNLPIGSFGTAGCFSFYPTKNMTTGEGGMITT